MSDHNTDNGGYLGGRDLIWPIVVMFLGLVLGIILLAIFLPESRDVTAIVTPLFATFTSLTVMVGGWVVARKVTDKVDAVKEIAENTAADTAEIKQQTNGKTDAEVERIAVSSAIRALKKHAEREGEPLE